MIEDRMGENGRTEEVIVDTHTHNKLPAPDKPYEQLLPGIPDAITLDHIASKLPWRDFHNLFRVSPAWKQAIRSHQVHEARIRLNSTEALVVLSHTSGPRGSPSLALYSTTDQSCFELPSLPGCETGMPDQCHFMAVDGKVYVMDPVMDGTEDHMGCVTSKVYVFDLAGQNGWKQCANMQVPRWNFACGVMDGKIYVFGGNSSYRPYGHLCVSEVYDPRANAWSSIKPMTVCRALHDVITIGEELFIHGGDVPIAVEDPYPFLEVYHPGKNRWRVVHSSAMQDSLQDSVFLAQGKMHFMTAKAVYVLDMGVDQVSWIQRHSFSLREIVLPTLPASSFTIVSPIVTIAINGELLALVYYESSEDDVVYLLQSKGFGSEKRELLWENNCSLSFGPSFIPFMCPILL